LGHLECNAQESSLTTPQCIPQGRVCTVAEKKYGRIETLPADAVYLHLVV